METGLNQQVTKIASIVDDMLSLAKMESDSLVLNFRQSSINTLIHKVCLSFEPAFINKGVAFEAAKNKRNYFVNIDPVYLERAFNNILSNALKYTDSGGKVVVSIHKQKQEVHIVVQDSGIGINALDLERIYQRFYQADNDINKAGGSGIGLAFSMEIVKMHQGMIYTKSKPNEGSRFEVVLPLVEDAQQVPLQNNNKVLYPSSSKSETPIAQQANCLIVDDHFEMRAYIKTILANYHCIEADNGQDALAKLENHDIDLVITDYMMPVMDGLRFIQAMKSQDFKMPVLMLTARTGQSTRLDVFQVGVDDYLVKPFDEDELVVRVNNALENYRSRVNFIKEKQVINAEVNASFEWMDKLKQYIEQHCQDLNLKQRQVADHFSMSESTLYRKIKSVTGKTPNEFITEVKLLKARSIVESNPDIALKRLALEVGFMHVSYFSKIYYNRFGHKPTKGSINNH